MAVLKRDRLRWYGHVLQNDDSEWVKKCVDFVVEGARFRGRPTITWKKVVEGDVKSLKINKDRSTLDGED